MASAFLKYFAIKKTAPYIREALSRIRIPMGVIPAKLNRSAENRVTEDWGQYENYNAGIALRGGCNSAADRPRVAKFRPKPRLGDGRRTKTGTGRPRSFIARFGPPQHHCGGVLRLQLLLLPQAGSRLRLPCRKRPLGGGSI